MSKNNIIALTFVAVFIIAMIVIDSYVIKPKPKIQWTGGIAVIISNDKGELSVGNLNGVQLGLKSDGTLIWRTIITNHVN